MQVKCKASKNKAVPAQPAPKIMSIPVEHEDVRALARWAWGLDRIVEDCVLCRAPTRLWHVAKNQPVCNECSQSHDVSDLTKRKAPESA